MIKNNGTKKILLLNGPNLNVLGKRDIAVYGTTTLKEIEESVEKEALSYGYTVTSFQSNYEGDLVTEAQKARDAYDGILINAAAFTHYSYSLVDALYYFEGPVIEIHISDIYKRELFRSQSVIRPACVGRISGLGAKGYNYALQQLIEIIEGKRGPMYEGETSSEYK